MEELNNFQINLRGWQSIAALISLSATGSFIGCWIFVKVFEFNKISINSKLSISKEQLMNIIKRRDETNREG